MFDPSVPISHQVRWPLFAAVFITFALGCAKSDSVPCDAPPVLTDVINTKRRAWEARDMVSQGFPRGEDLRALLFARACVEEKDSRPTVAVMSEPPTDSVWSRRTGAIRV